MLNRSKPYADVFGLPGVRFEQGGRLYRADGTQFGDGPPAEPAPPPEPSPDVVIVDGATENDRTGEMSRAEIVAELRRLNVKFSPSKSTPVLQALLDAKREEEAA